MKIKTIQLGFYALLSVQPQPQTQTIMSPENFSFIFGFQNIDYCVYT